jgi:polysaccharide biosynthesis protein PslG
MRKGIATAGVAVAVLMAGAAGAKAVTPNPFYGAVAVHFPIQPELERMAAAGGGTMRFQVDWRYTEPHPGVRKYFGTDWLFGGAAKAGVTILPNLLGVPRWMSRDRSRIPMFTRSQRTEWRTLLTDYARRYGSNGTFWAGHPEIPKRPVTTWEIWNEPNLGYWVGGTPNPRRYVRFLQISGEALRAGDPAAKVQTGGLFPYKTTHNSMPLIKYLKAMYRTPGGADSFDVLGVHPYAARPGQVLQLMKVVRGVMRRHGDGGTPMSASAFGWFTGGLGIRYTQLHTSRRQQAAKLAKTFSLLAGNASALGISNALWYTFSDSARRGRDIYLDRAGLFTLKGRAKPSWSAFARVAGGTP